MRAINRTRGNRAIQRRSSLPTLPTATTKARFDGDGTRLYLPVLVRRGTVSSVGKGRRLLSVGFTLYTG